MNTMNSDKDAAIEAWRRAAQELGIEVVAPFSFVKHGRKRECLAWVPKFGGDRGIVLAATSPPDFAIDQDLRQAAAREGYRWSAVNVVAYATFDRDKFVEALADWGFAGPADERPLWLPPSNGHGARSP